jgi:vacuolar protein sorting-associated protein 13D
VPELNQAIDGNSSLNLSFEKSANDSSTRGFSATYQRMNTTSISLDEINMNDRDCLLDLIDIKFIDTHLYSATRSSIETFQSINNSLANDNSIENAFVNFISFGFRKNAKSILKQNRIINFQVERNLENELSHKSPDWKVYAKFSSVNIILDLDQYKLIRGILDKNIGEQIVNKTQLPTNFIIQNTRLDTVLSGRVWNVISIKFDLENVGIELLNERKVSLAHLSFIKSSLTFESFSDDSKLTDLVSNEIILTDTRQNTMNLYNNVLSKKTDNNKINNEGGSNLSCDSTSSNSKRLQLEIHFKSNKKYQRFSILFNNCQVITKIDWLIEMKNFLTSNVNDSVSSTPDHKINPSFNLNNNQENKQELPIQIKLNLTNTDFILIENLDQLSSQAIILRLTTFFEYDQTRYERPIESSLQSFELFSCQMNAIEQTALSIIDRVMFNIHLRCKEQNFSNDKTDLEYILDVSTEIFRLRFSYLDFNLFLKVIESVKTQFKSDKDEENVAKSIENRITTQVDLALLELDSSLNIQDKKSAEDVKSITNTNNNKNKLLISDVNLSISNFCICIIDDCNDIDIPLADIQFSRFSLLNNLNTNVQKTEGFSLTNQSNGTAEFALNIDYYNRLLSGWEPLIEPWLARINWKFKSNKNVFTITSMDVLNLNITNPFIDLITGFLFLNLFELKIDCF